MKATINKNDLSLITEQYTHSEILIVFHNSVPMHIPPAVTTLLTSAAVEYSQTFVIQV